MTQPAASVPNPFLDGWGPVHAFRAQRVPGGPLPESGRPPAANPFRGFGFPASETARRFAARPADRAAAQAAGRAEVISLSGHPDFEIRRSGGREAVYAVDAAGRAELAAAVSVSLIPRAARAFARENAGPAHPAGR